MIEEGRDGPLKGLLYTICNLRSLKFVMYGNAANAQGRYDDAFSTSGLPFR